MDDFIGMRQASGIGHVVFEKPEQDIVAQHEVPRRVFVGELGVIKPEAFVFGVDLENIIRRWQMCKTVPKYN